MQSHKDRCCDRPRQWRMSGFNSAHLCSNVCFKASGAKLQWIACWERAHTASWLRPNVDAAKWYSWERSVQNTPLSSVWVEKEENDGDVGMYFKSVSTTHYKRRRDTHTKHTRVLALVPVQEVMFVVWRYCLTFDIRGQAQFWKQSGGSKWHKMESKHNKIWDPRSRQLT